MTILRRRVFKAVIFLAAVVSAAYLSLFFIVKSFGFQQWLKAEIADRTGYDVSVGDLRLSVPWHLVASAIAVSKSSKTVLKGEHVALTLSPIDLFSKTLHRLQLQKPTFYLDVHELFDSSAKTAADIAIRHLNITDGTVVLKTGEGSTLDFRSINVNAENLNLGRTTGVSLRTELPWLKGGAEITIRGEADQMAAEIRVQQTKFGRLSRFLFPNGPTTEVLKAQIKLRRKASQELEVVAAGKLVALSIGDSNISGEFDVHSNIDPGIKNVAFSGKIAADLPSNLGSLSLSSAKQGVTARLNGNFSIPEKQMTLKALHLESVLATADGGATLRFDPEPVFSDAHLTLREVALEPWKSLLPEAFRDWSYTARASAELDLQGPWRSVAIKGVVQSDGSPFKSNLFSLGRLTLTVPFEWANGSIHAADIGIIGKTFAINQKQRTQLAAEEIRVDGRLDKKGSAPWQAAGKLRILRGRFATPDGSKVGENLTLSGPFDITTAHENGLVSVTGKLDMEQGEILWGKFFRDLKTQQPAIDFDGDYSASDDALRLRRLNLSLANVGKVEVTGSVDHVTESPALRVAMTSNDFQPAGFFEVFIRETWNRSYPVLDQLAIGGRASFSLRVRGGMDDLAANGEIQLRAGDLHVKSNKWQIGPLDLVLPFQVHWPAANPAATSANTEAGTLTIQSARLGSESIPTLKTAVSLWDNRLRLEQPIRIPIYGGSVEISNLAWKDVIGDPRAVSLSMDTKNLQLQNLTEALDWYRFGGTLSGSIPQVDWSGGALRSQGQIQVQVFGGQILISKMEIDNPFSSLASIKLDSRFQAIDLERASETFKFGKISGILEGSVNDLILTDGQPSQWVAEIHSVEKSGISQWISVEALNKITVLSSGNDAGALYGGLAAFFDNFRYSKLGFKATLRNDKLTLRGIESKDGKEFLVVGSFLPPTVNIISHTQEISFSELVRRLEQMRKADTPQIK